jgi:hypothetical protein
MVDLAARLDRIERKLDIGLRAEIDAYASGLAERIRNR